MALVNKGLGAPVIISRGRKGERPDFYPARIVDQAQMVVAPNGRLNEIATVIAYQPTLEGEMRLASFPHNLAFAYDRSERVEALDGTPSAPKTWKELIADQTAQTLKFLAGRPESVDSIDVADLTDPAGA